MKYKMKQSKRIFIFFCAATSMFSQANVNNVIAPNNDTGLLIVFDSKNRNVSEGQTELTKLGCRVWRQGKMSTSGTMTIGAVDRFILAQCKKSVLAKEESRGMLQSRFRKDQVGLILEGNFIRKELNFADTNTAQSRGYLIKISRFNNLHSERDSEENNIDSTANKRTEKWKTEARIRVHHAVGIATPDEVGVIYYASPKMMNEFVKNSPDLVDEIGSFNRRHLIEAKYLTLEVEK